MGLPQASLRNETTHKSGFRASRFLVEFPPEHAHRHLSDILRLIDRGEMSVRAKEIAKQLFECIGKSGSQGPWSSYRVDSFPRSGRLGLNRDIVGVAVAWDELGIESAFCSPIPVGYGSIEIAHGRVSLPAPATAEILRGIPLAACSIPKEMTTPTELLSQRFSPVALVRSQP